MDGSIATPEEVAVDSERLALIRPAMQAYIDRHGYAGISTMLARRGRVIHFEQLGRQDREQQTALSPDTIFRIYSMTKPIVCSAFMTLFDEGRVGLLDPVAKYLPGFATLRVLHRNASSELHGEDLARPITIHDLLTHTAGLTYDFLEDSPVGELYRQARLMGDSGRSLEAMLAELVRLPLAYHPGSRWHYSVAIDVIAHLIEIISGRPLPQFLGERLFLPLGMADTAYFVPPAKRGRLATMYGHPDVAVNSLSQIVRAWRKGQNERRDVEATYPAGNDHSFARGGHGLFSTAPDYMRFAQMLLNRGVLGGRRILAAKSVDLMQTNQLPAALLPFEMAGIVFKGYGFGLGSRALLDAAESGLPASIGEFGWNGAAKTFFWIDPRQELIGIMMSQYMAGFDQPEKVFQGMAYQALMPGRRGRS